MRYKNPYSIDFLFNEDEACRYVNEHFILERVKKFFKIREVSKFEELRNRFCITDLNFKSVKFEYFYENLLRDISKKSGNINFIRYTITFDKQLTTQKCERTDMFYNELLLGEKPILYFIYFDLQEVYDAIRNYIKNRGK